jgi:hypothetical protein
MKFTFVVGMCSLFMLTACATRVPGGFRTVVTELSDCARCDEGLQGLKRLHALSRSRGEVSGRMRANSGEEKRPGASTVATYPALLILVDVSPSVPLARGPLRLLCCSARTQSLKSRRLFPRSGVR